MPHSSQPFTKLTRMEGKEIGVDGLGVTASMLTNSENKIFDSMVSQFSRTFRGKLYRDGVPVPHVYLSTPVRVLFVFREPNFKNKPKGMKLASLSTRL